MAADRPATAEDIIRWLCRRWMQSFLLPNYTPSGWRECDVFEMTKAGYFREYEVKVSRGDFFADASKQKQHRVEIECEVNTPELFRPAKTEWRLERKHELLESRCIRGPSRFWYVVPAGLVEVEEVPAWAGLMEAEGCYLKTVKEAPKLHGEKVRPCVEKHARSVCYYRMHEYRKKAIK